MNPAEVGTTSQKRAQPVDKHYNDILAIFMTGLEAPGALIAAAESLL